MDSEREREIEIDGQRDRKIGKQIDRQTDDKDRERERD